MVVGSPMERTARQAIGRGPAVSRDCFRLRADTADDTCCCRRVSIPGDFESASADAISSRVPPPLNNLPRHIAAEYLRQMDENAVHRILTPTPQSRWNEVRLVHQKQRLMGVPAVSATRLNTQSAGRGIQPRRETRL